GGSESEPTTRRSIERGTTVPRVGLRVHNRQSPARSVLRREEVVMLGPGELLLKPPDEPPTPPADRAEEPVSPPTPTAGADDDEPETFLQRLLRALGAIHT